MTMTEVPTRLPVGRAWTFDDLAHLPEGNRYEIVDGSLLVSPPPSLDHGSQTLYLRRQLEQQLPADTVVMENIRVQVRQWPTETTFVPDLTVLRETRLRLGGQTLAAKEALLVVEVMSPHNLRFDQGQKRLEYAAAGIPDYWIVDPRARMLILMSGPDGTDYQTEHRIPVGEFWSSATPFSLRIDVAAIFRGQP